MSTQNTEKELLAIKAGLKSLCEFQDKLDNETWQIQNPVMAKLRHISLHLAKINGNVANMCHGWEHALINNPDIEHSIEHIDQEALSGLAADLIIHATQLSNIINADLFKIFIQKVSKNLQRFAPDSKMNLDVSAIEISTKD
jgi:hypothetical protein